MMEEGKLEQISHDGAEKDKKMKKMRQTDNKRIENGGPTCGQLFLL